MVTLSGVSTSPTRLLSIIGPCIRLMCTLWSTVSTLFICSSELNITCMRACKREFYNGARLYITANSNDLLIMYQIMFISTTYPTTPFFTIIKSNAERNSKSSMLKHIVLSLSLINKQYEIDFSSEL